MGKLASDQGIWEYGNKGHERIVELF